MLDIEFWFLMGVYGVHTLLVLGAAYLIMRVQNAFNARLHSEVSAAIVSIREDMKKPELFKEVGHGIAEQVGTSVRNSLAGMYGNLTKTVNGPANEPLAKFFYVLTARNKMGAMKKVMMDGSGIGVLPSGSGPNQIEGRNTSAGINNDSDGGPGQRATSSNPGLHDSQKIEMLNREVRLLIEQDPAMQAKIDAKAKELGLA